MSEYTPTTEDVREAFSQEVYDEDGCTAFSDDRAAIFDSWLTQAIATAKTEGISIGYADGMRDGGVVALREVRRVVVRMYPKGLVDRATVIADLDDYIARANTLGE